MSKRAVFALTVTFVVGSLLFLWGASHRILEDELGAAYQRSLAHELYTVEDADALLGRPLIVMLRLVDDDAVRKRVGEAVCFSHVFNAMYGAFEEACAAAAVGAANPHTGGGQFVRATGYAHQAGRVPRALSMAEEELRLLAARHDDPHRDAALPLLEFIEILKRSIEEQQAARAEGNGDPPDDDDPSTWLQDAGAGDDGAEGVGY